MTRSLHIGAAVREVGTGKLGRVVRIPRYLRLRGMFPVQFDGEHTWRNVSVRHLHYVARRYADAVAWEAGHAGAAR